MGHDFDPRSYDHENERHNHAERDRVTQDPRDPKDRASLDDVFTRDLDVPRGRERELLSVWGRSHELRDTQVRALATIGAFRAVPAGDLRDPDARPLRVDRGDLYELRRGGLIRVVTPEINRQRTAIVTLTRRGRALLEAHRRQSGPDRQTFYAGIARSRELAHDAQMYRAYTQTAERLRDQGASIVRVRLDHELKRDYQRFLQDGNRGRPDSDGRPSRHADEIRDWAEAHHLPYFDDRVHFPDVRVEYERPDGVRGFEDLEIRTPHYRGMHAAAKAKSGFTPFDPDFAKEFV
jgi:hypothetical protein